MVIFCTMISGWSSEKGSSLSFHPRWKTSTVHVFMLSSSVSSARARDLRSDRVERCFWFQCGFQDSFKHTEAINNEENRRTGKGIINTESHWS